jgi:hypothetical protein
MELACPSWTKNRCDRSGLAFNLWMKIDNISSKDPSNVCLDEFCDGMETQKYIYARPIISAIFLEMF